MAEQKQRESESAKQTGRHFWFYIVAVVLIGAVGVVYLARSQPGFDERVASFEAARAVPDEENAAIIYAELLQGPEIPRDEAAAKIDIAAEAALNPVFVKEIRSARRRLIDLELPKGLLDPNAEAITRQHSWKSADYPELKQWLDKHQKRIDKLQEAAAKSSCYFPLRPAAGRMGLFDVPLGAFKQDAFILIRAANNDLGEGITAAGLAKCRALVSMGRHLSQQPATLYLMNGIALEAIGTHRLAEFIVTGPATDQDLDALTIACDDLDDHLQSINRDASQARQIFSHLLVDRRRLTERLAEWLGQVFFNAGRLGENHLNELYRRLLCERRAQRMLIELRRFKNKTGHWPESLAVIAGNLPPVALIDPQNDGPYVYGLTDDGFRLYSRGPNGRDEDGRYKWDGPDDWTIWPKQQTNDG